MSGLELLDAGHWVPEESYGKVTSEVNAGEASSICSTWVMLS